LSDNELSYDEPESKEQRRAIFEARVKEASELVEELRAQGISEKQDLIRALRSRFPANVITKVLGISGRELKAPRNPDLRVKEVSNSTILESLADTARAVSKRKIEEWLELGRAVEDLRLIEAARA
jgi:hypothetical protein